MDNAAKIFPASLDSLEPIRDHVSAKCEALGFNKKKTYGLCLAIDEIATNIINYGYPQAGIGLGIIELLMADEGKQLTVTLIDTAVAFNPLNHLVPNQEDMNKPLEDRPIGGLGILLAQQNVDEFRYERRGDQNCNVFVVNAAS